MIILSWRDDYRVGVALIDGEHRYLFGLINEFHDLCTSEEMRPRLVPLLNRLVAYAETHFQHEEALQREAGYPRVSRHQDLHEKLYSSIYALTEKLASDPGQVDAGLQRFLKSFIYHILNEDLDVADFLKRKAVQDDKARALAAEKSSSSGEVRP